jgi:transposase
MDIKNSRSISETEANAIYQRGREVTVLFILQQAQQIGQKSQRIEELEAQLSLLKSTLTDLPATPSGMIPVFKKPSIQNHPSQPGQKKGHQGTRRGAPAKIDHHQEHTLLICPECQSELPPAVEQRKRYIEDIPKVSMEVTEHLINRYYCKHCQKMVEPKITEALPGATIGNNIVILSAFWHYAMGITVSHIIEILKSHLHFPISAGGLIQVWNRLSDMLQPVYEEIGMDIRQNGKLQADETGWRVNGQTHWLWCFSDMFNTYYQIEHCRGSPVILEFLGEDYDGLLITDFFSAYNKVENAERQVCLAHLFRELVTVDERNSGLEWRDFRKRLKRLLKDGLRLKSRQAEASEPSFEHRKELLHQRLKAVFTGDYQDADCRRLSKRLRRHQEHIFTFLKYLDVPSDNNQSEREIRPAVIMRKNSNGNRSTNGAETQAILMTIFRTLKRQNLPVLESVNQIMEQHLKDNLTPILNLLHSAK